jgi:hypothetical protein
MIGVIIFANNGEVSMGINSETARALIYLRKNGIVGPEMLSLGRSELFIELNDIGKINLDMGMGWSKEQMDLFFANRFADQFLRCCGFDVIKSLDASPFENAEIVHDLNKPIPVELRGCTGFLYDGGTLEHVFDVATAVANVIGLVKVGGIVLLAPPANTKTL